MKTHPVLVPGDRTVPWSAAAGDRTRLVPLKYMADINSDVLSDDTPPDTPLDYVDISSVDRDGRILGVEPLTFEKAPSRARRLVREGDTIVSTVRTYLRAVAFIRQEHAHCVVSTGFAVVRPGAALDPRFLFYWLRSTPFVDEVCARSTGVSYPAINASEIGSLPVPRLPLQQQKTIAQHLDRETELVAARINVKRQQIELLEQQQAALITSELFGALKG